MFGFLRSLFSAFPNQESTYGQQPQRRRNSLTGNIASGFVSEMKRAASDVQHQVRRRK